MYYVLGLNCNLIDNFGNTALINTNKLLSYFFVYFYFCKGILLQLTNAYIISLKIDNWEFCFYAEESCYLIFIQKFKKTILLILSYFQIPR